MISKTRDGHEHQERRREISVHDAHEIDQALSYQMIVSVKRDPLNLAIE